MTRETKIGLLTGLGVIVLIGVLLSEYLGGGTKSSTLERPAAMLDKGSGYRAAALTPVGVPGTEGPGSLGQASHDYGVPGAQDQDGVALAPRDGKAGPLVGQPAMPRPAGRMPDVPAMDGLGRGPVLDLVDPTTGRPVEAVYTPVDPRKTGPATAMDAARAAAALPTGEMYTIVPRDTLTAIARKFYKSVGKADIQRIIAANLSILKDETTPLVVGKKLLIPPAPAAAVAVAPKLADPRAAVPAPARPGVAPPVVIGPPGGGPDRVGAPAGSVPAPAVAKPRDASYKVQPGDSLGKIAKKFYGTASDDAVKRIMVANKISKPEALQAGAVLTIPSPAAH